MVLRLILGCNNQLEGIGYKNQFEHSSVKMEPSHYVPGDYSHRIPPITVQEESDLL